MKRVKRFVSLLLVLCLVLGTVSETAFAAEIASGTCRDNLTWSLTDDGALAWEAVGNEEKENETVAVKSMNGEEVYTTSDVAVGGTVTEPAAPAMLGNPFLSRDADTACTAMYDLSAADTESVMLSAGMQQNFTVSVSSSTADAGSTATLDLSVSNNTEMSSLTVRVYYKSDVLTCTSVNVRKDSNNNDNAWGKFHAHCDDTHGKMPSAAANPNDTVNISADRATDGWKMASLAYAAHPSETFKGNGVIASLTFAVNADAESCETPVEVEIVKATGAAAAVLTTTAEGGKISVGGVRAFVASGYCGGEGDGTNLRWVLTDDGTLTISGSGKMEDYSSSSSVPFPWYSYRKTIKKAVVANGVESIGEGAFEWCDRLTSVTIGDSVITIGEDAFSCCDRLTSVTIPDSVTTIGDYAFYSCYRLTSVTIGSSVTTIGEWAFSYCRSLTSVTIPDSVTTIGDSAFCGCTSLTSVTIPDSVTAIGRYAFYGCSSLTSVTIPDSVTAIGEYAFLYCDRLTSIYFWGGAPEIGYSAFGDVSELPEGFALCYVPGTSGWTDSADYDAAAGTWNGYPLKTWEGDTGDDDGGSQPGEDAESLKLLSQYPENQATDIPVSYNPLTISMTFNREVDSVQVKKGMFTISRQNEEAEGWEFETVYTLENVEEDVTIDGKTVKIDVSDASWDAEETYYVQMSPTVIIFKDTDDQVSFGGTQWVFTTKKEFTLEKDNNNFVHTNTGDWAGFTGVKRHTLSLSLYNKLLGHMKGAEKLRLTLKLLAGSWNGSCHGIASTMALAYSDQLDLSQFADGIDNYYDMPLPCKDKDFLECISYFHLGQNAMNYHGADMSQISGLFPEFLQTLKDGPALFSYSYGDSGHTILALDYELDSNGNYLVHMYDMNSWTPDNGGKITTLVIEKDYSDFALQTIHDTVMTKKDFSYIQFISLDEVAAINPYKGKRTMSYTFASYASRESQTVLLSVPLSHSPFSLENTQGETLTYNEDGSFSGTMEVLDKRIYFSDEGSAWELTVGAAESFCLTDCGESVDLGLYSEDGAVVLSGKDIGGTTISINDGMVLEGASSGDSYEFVAYFASNVDGNDDINVFQIGATATGDTVIDVEGDRISATATSLVNKDLVLFDELKETPLKDLDSTDSTIVVDGEASLTMPEGYNLEIQAEGKLPVNTKTLLVSYDYQGKMLSSVFGTQKSENVWVFPIESLPANSSASKVFFMDSSYNPVAKSQTVPITA